MHLSTSGRVFALAYAPKFCKVELSLKSTTGGEISLEVAYKEAIIAAMGPAVDQHNLYNTLLTSLGKLRDGTVKSLLRPQRSYQPR